MEEYVKDIAGVHVAPGSQTESPKDIEQRRRDKGMKEQVGTHNFIDFRLIPEKWRGVLTCRACKRNLIQYVAEDMLRLMSHTLHSHQQTTLMYAEDSGDD
jgi:hypothetical protein